MNYKPFAKTEASLGGSQVKKEQNTQKPHLQAFHHYRDAIHSLKCIVRCVGG